jgi:Zincin-like metallopeptidase
MICAELGISDCDFTNGAAYVGHWVSKLRDDKREVFRATADAQWIADFLLAFHLDFVAKRAEPDAQPAARSRSRDEVTMRVRVIPSRARAGGVRSRSPIPRLAVGFLA